MKSWGVLFLLALISCGPSEEEIQSRIDQAVKDANPTTTTLPLPIEECNKFINEVTFVFESVDTNLDTLFEGSGTDNHLKFLSTQIGKLNSLEDILSRIKSRTDKELEILVSLENYRSGAHEYRVLYFRNLLNYVPTDDPQFQKMFDTMHEAEDLGRQLKIRINNYKCEY